MTQTEISNLISELTSQNFILTKIENVICEKYTEEEILQIEKENEKIPKMFTLTNIKELRGESTN